MCHYSYMDLSDIHQYHIDKHHQHTMINIDIRIHLSKISFYYMIEVWEENHYGIKTCSISITWLRKTIINSLCTCCSKPTRCTITSIWTNFIHTSFRHIDGKTVHSLISWSHWTPVYVGGHIQRYWPPFKL
jgi:hypothetical protein